MERTKRNPKMEKTLGKNGKNNSGIVQPIDFAGAQGRNRTTDTRIFSPSFLY